MLSVADLWEREWKNAYSFFSSQGNINTKNKLKTKWYNDFKEICRLIEIEVQKATADNIRKKKGSH